MINFRCLLLFIFILSNCSLYGTKHGAPFTQKDILNALEQYGPGKYHFFIDLEHSYFHTAGSRLSLYADKTRWAIVFEKSGYDNRGYRGEIELTYYGNCLKNLTEEGVPGWGTSNMKTITVITGDELERIENTSHLAIVSAEG